MNPFVKMLNKVEASKAKKAIERKIEDRKKTPNSRWRASDTPRSAKAYAKHKTRQKNQRKMHRIPACRPSYAS